MRVLLPTLGLIVYCACFVSCTRSESSIDQPVTLPESFSKSGIATIPDQWWNSFKDPGLNQAIELALADNFTVKQARDRLLQAQAVARKAGSDKFPELDLLAGAGRSKRTDESAQNEFSLGLSVSYELDVWGRLGSAAHASELEADAKQEDVYSAAISLSADVAETWYDIAATQARVDLFKSELETQQSIAQIIKEQFKYGKVRAADVYRQEQLQAGTQASLVKEVGDLRVLQHKLRLLLGKTPKSLLDLPAPRFVGLPALPKTGVPSQVLDRRPDVRRAWLMVLSANKSVSVAHADRYPRISLSASATTASDSVGDLFDAWVFRLVGNVVQPLFDGGRRRAELQRTRAVLTERVHEYAQVVLVAMKEVEDALVQEAQQVKFLEHVNEQLAANNKVLERTQDLYKQGQSDYLRVLESLTSHLTIKERQVNAQLDLIAFRIQLYKSLAGYWHVDPQQDPSLEVKP